MTKFKAEIKNRFFFLISLLSFLTYIFLPTVQADEFVITDNGSGSTNEVQVQAESQTNINQDNESNVTNEVNTSVNTGDNSASGNTNGDVAITTGDSNTQINIENTANTSSVETGCCTSGTTAQISGNGANSTNQINTSSSSTANIIVYQNATITNNINGYVNTGNNSADDNTGGNVEITTGNIKVQGNIINGPTNYSNVEAAFGLASFASKISDNGTNSENKINVNFDYQRNINTNFNADLDNYVVWDLNTGGNSADGNTDGNVTINTGDISLDFFIKNFVNLGKVEITCCPTKKEKEVEKPPPEGPPSEEEKENGGVGAGVGGGGGGGGQILPEAAAVEAGGPGIDGLSVTSSNNYQSLLFFIGLAMVAFGGKIATNELFQKTSKRKR